MRRCRLGEVCGSSGGAARACLVGLLARLPIRPGWPACDNGVVIDPSQDAFGAALLDYLEGKEVPGLVLEEEAGQAGPALRPEWFFRSFGQWDWWDREILPLVGQGPILDLGAGAGRAALYLQEQGLRVTAVEASPGAAEVCRRRGVTDVRLGDLNDPPADLPWAGVLLMCGNLGLGGSWDASRHLLARLAELVTPGAVLVGDSVTPDGPARVVLRIRYRGLVTPWWPQYNIPAGQMAALVDGTGWRMEMHLEDGEDHAVLLRRA
jgi:SAM-dependent methyltransferase